MRLKKVLRWSAILILFGVIAFFGYSSIGVLAFSGAFEPTYTKRDLINNYNKNQEQILALKQYFNSIVPKYNDVEIEFDGNHKLFRFGVSSRDSISGSTIYPIFLDWNLKLNSPKVDSVIATIGWTQNTLKEIKKKLDNANCIQIQSGEPARIGFQRSGMGMYFYELFDKEIPDSLRNYYNDSCRYILYNDKLVLEYDGGAAGPQCFPEINMKGTRND